MTVNRTGAFHAASIGPQQRQTVQAAAVDLIIIILFINLGLILHSSLIASAMNATPTIYSCPGAAYLHDNSASEFL
jgi:hypothetical protein